MEEEQVWYGALSNDAQRKIDQDNNNQRIWYAKRHGKGHQVMGFDANLEELHQAQGGAGKGWMRVVYQEEEERAE